MTWIRSVIVAALVMAGLILGAPLATAQDLDCADIGFQVDTTLGDPHNLDADGDGIGCEEYPGPPQELENADLAPGEDPTLIDEPVSVPTSVPAGVQAQEPEPDTPPGTVTIVDLWLNFLMGVGLPALVALVSNRYATHRFKALMLAFLTAATVLVQTLLDQGADFSNWQLLLTRFFMTFIMAVVAHYGLLKPTGVTGVDGAIPKSLPAGAGGRHARGRAPDTA